MWLWLPSCRWMLGRTSALVDGGGLFVLWCQCACGTCEGGRTSVFDLLLVLHHSAPKEKVILLEPQATDFCDCQAGVGIFEL